MNSNREILLPVMQDEPVVSESPLRAKHASRKPQKLILLRRKQDSAQALRSGVQAAFLLLNVWIGLQFFLWVRFWEKGGQGFSVARPPGVEGWLPIASLMNLKAWLLGAGLPEIHPAGVVLFVLFSGLSLFFRKSFCSWLCPVGTLSEALWQSGRKILKRNFRIPPWLDFPLRSLKYVLLAFFLWAVFSMSVQAIRIFLDGPYGIVADVKMLNFFRRLDVVGIWTLSILILLSMAVQNFWCRYLCPYGAWMGLLSLFSPTAIRRDPERCIDCAKCAKACPSWLPVDQKVRIYSAECTGCLECIAVCPAEGALELRWARQRLGGAALTVLIVLLFLGTVAAARWSGHWETRLPDSVYRELVPRADQFGHP